MIFVDSNVPMYLIGADHRHKFDAQRLITRAVAGGEPLFTDAEVLQEICHRYRALRRDVFIQAAFDLTLALVDGVLPVTGDDALAAKDILLGYESLSARDALHVAVMRAHGITRIMSFDRGYDAHPGIERLA